MKKIIPRLGKWMVILIAFSIGLEIFLWATPFGIPSRMDIYGRRKSFLKNNLNDAFLRIVCLGDSLTFGYKIKEKYAWPTILRNRMRSIEDRTDIEVLNAGIRGHTSAQLLERLDRDVSSRSPDLVIVWVGMNDAWLISDSGSEGKSPSFRKPSPFLYLETINSIVSSDLLSRFARRFRPDRKTGNLTARVPLEKFQTNIRNLCTSLRMNGLDNTLFLSLPELTPPVGAPNAATILQRKTLRIYNSMLTTLAARRGFRCVDLSGMYLTKGASIYKADGIHLNRKGTAALVEWLYPEVEEALKNKRRMKKIHEPRALSKNI